MMDKYTEAEMKEAREEALRKIQQILDEYSAKYGDKKLDVHINVTFVYQSDVQAQVRSTEDGQTRYNNRDREVCKRRTGI
jgi:hypothetical protein